MSEDGFLLPTGTVTLVLADVAGSTRAWEADPEATKAALAALNATVDDLIGQYSGVRPLEQGEGDSFVAAFGRAHDAVCCALAIQRALVENRLKLRVGVHTGDVLRRDDRNYAGPTVNRAARVRNLGSGGQTLLSQATYDLVVDHLPEGASLTDLGSHRLRDLARPERVWQLDHPDLPSRFPPLRSLDSFAHNLPIQRTSFIGRVKEITELRTLVKETQLVTVTGSGGCGKTRLVLQLAAEVVGEWPDGVWFVDLAVVGDEAGVIDQVAQVLGVRESPDVPLDDALAARLGSQQALLILDNCEHVVGTAATLTDHLLTRCRRLHVLATSRQPLGLDGEFTWRLPSLAVPVDDAPAGIAAVGGCEAAQLFVDRARRAGAGFELTEANAAAVGVICRRLDGIPLAIELAAARTRVFAVSEIAEALSERFRILTGSIRTALPRQQTLEASVAWSYDLLTEPERIVLRALSVFAGSFSFEAAAAICVGGAIQTHHVLDLLSLLVDKSLVLVDDRGYQGRYRLLETVRLFSSERLAATDDNLDTRRRHVDYYTQLIEDPDASLTGAREAHWLATIERDYPNLRAALAWCRDSGDGPRLVRLAAILGRAWWIQGPWSEGAAFLDAALAAGGSDQSAAWVALRRAQVAIGLGDINTAGACATAGLEVARRVGDDHLAAWCLATIGLAQHPDHRPDLNSDPRPSLNEAEALARRVDRADLLAEVLWTAAMFYNGSDPTRAIAYANEAIEICEAHDFDATAAKSLASLGLGHWERGDMIESIAALDRAIDRAEACNDTFAGLHARYLRAPALVHAGRLSDALLAADDLELRITNAGTHLFDGFAELVRGLVALSEARNAEAIDWISRASRVHASPYGRIFLLYHLAEAHLAAGQTAEAERIALEAKTTADTLEIRTTQSQARSVLARLRRLADDPVDAERWAHESLDYATMHMNRAEIANGLEVLAGIATDLESFEEAARLIGAAQAARDATGYRHVATEREADLAQLRDVLGQDRFDRLVSEGRNLSVNEALAYAKRGRGSRKRPSTGWASLSPVETQVVSLVQEGLTNAEVGERLFISPRTVQAHLSHIFAKLGITSRTDLAAQAVKRGL